MSDAGMTAVKLPVWLRLGLGLLFLVTAIYSGMGNVEAIALNAGLLPGGEPTGLTLELRDGWHMVRSVDRDTPGEGAGIRAGDLLRYDVQFDDARNHLAGDRIGVTIDRGGAISRRVIEIGALADVPGSEGARAGNILFAFAGLITLGFGALVLSRGWNNAPALLLVAVLISFAGQAHYEPLWTKDLAHPYLFIFPTAVNLAMHNVFPSFCLLIAGRHLARGWRLAVHIFSGASVTLAIATIYCLANATPILGIFLGLNVLIGNEIGSAIVSLAVLLGNYRRNDAVSRNRIRIVLFAFLAFALGLQIALVLPFSVTPTGPILLANLFAKFLIDIAAPSLLAYAVLKQRLLDLGFVINRTLVYGAVSFVLLAGFGLAEWAVDHLIPEEWHKESALYSAGIALLLFLSFHRLRDWIEHHVERLFFHSWQSNEARLRRFVESAAHYERSERLIEDASAEFGRFTGASVAIYWREGDAYRVAGGTLPDGARSVDADDPALVQMRADRAPVEPSTSRSAILAALVLPMIDHGTLIGFVAVGPKPDSPGYRPDERDAMAWAAQQIGLDCQSMRARDLDARLIEMNRSIVALQAQNDALTALLGTALPGRAQPAG